MTLQQKYQVTIDAVVPLLMKKPLASLKKYLIQYRREIPQADIEKCTDKELLIALVTNRCSITQCHLLYLMAEYFNEKRALKLVEDYNFYKNEVYSTIKATEFSEQLYSHKGFSGEIQVCLG